MDMAFFMDRHDLEGATAADMAAAHMSDLDAQKAHDVRFLSYWFDYDRQAAFCLVEAPDAEAAQAVHRHAHGQVANEILPVDPDEVQRFLGRVDDPLAGGRAAASAFRMILFTDLEGSTAMVQRLGDDGAMELLRRHDAIVREALGQHSGREVKHTGDGIMASFASVQSGLAAAVDIQRAFAAHAETDEAPMKVRIGLSAGEPVTEGQDLFGCGGAARRAALQPRRARKHRRLGRRPRSQHRQGVRLRSAARRRAQGVPGAGRGLRAHLGDGGVTGPRAPVILVVDDEEEARGRVTRELGRRLSNDYRIAAEATADAALVLLRELRDAGEEVALVLADQWMPGRTGTEVLAGVPAIFPRARRGLLVDFGAWGDPATSKAILRAVGLGSCDYYVLKPWRSPDELFHRTVSEFLHEWARSDEGGPREVVVVGPSVDRRTHEIRNLLVCSGIPSAFRPIDAAGTEGTLPSTARLPAVVFHDGRVLERPTNAEIAEAFGLRTTLRHSEVDIAVIGAGPGGLGAAVYAASEGLDTLVVEREAIGGQAGSSSLIRNYLGFARGIAGADLTMRAYQQAWVFGATFVLMNEVRDLVAEGGRLALTLSDDARALAGAVVLATGVNYRRLGIPALEELVGAGVFYGASISQAQALAGRSVYVVGGGNSAGQAAMHLSAHAGKVTILIRGESLASTHVALPHRPGRSRAEHRGAPAHRGGGRVGRGAARAPRAGRPPRRGAHDRRGVGPVRADRRAAALGLAAGRGGPRRPGLHPDGV